MTGWIWCPGVRDRCRECLRTTLGVWRYKINQTTATMVICADCAGGTEVAA